MNNTKSVFSHLKRFCTNIRLTLLIGILLPFIELLLRSLGFARVSRLIKNLIYKTRLINSNSNDSRYVEANIRRYNRYIKRISQNPLIPGNCLAKSLTLYYLLARKHIETTLKFGQRKTNGGSFKAHAWLEYQGVPINDVVNINEIYTSFEQSFDRLP